MSLIFFEFFDECRDLIDEVSGETIKVASISGFLARLAFSFPKRCAGSSEFEPMVIAIGVEPLCEFCNFTL